MYVSTEYARVRCKECGHDFIIYPAKEFKQVECKCTEKPEGPKRRTRKKDAD